MPQNNDVHCSKEQGPSPSPADHSVKLRTQSGCTPCRKKVIYGVCPNDVERLRHNVGNLIVLYMAFKPLLNML
jgi:hypothetical protein